jgi:hypothetical protein
MNLLKRIALFGLATAFIVVLMQISAAAQMRRVVVNTSSQPIVIRQVYYHRYYDPFWRGTLWDPYGYYNPYYYDPYLRERQERYYREKAVRDARRRIAKHREKYRSDGYLTPKEREKLAKDQRKYEQAVAKLNSYNRNY